MPVFWIMKIEDPLEFALMGIFYLSCSLRDICHLPL
jgi:hypothetical protein